MRRKKLGTWWAASWEDAWGGEGCWLPVFVEGEGRDGGGEWCECALLSQGCGKAGADGKDSVHVDVRLGARVRLSVWVGYQAMPSAEPSIHKTPTHNASPGPWHHKSRT